MEIVMATFIVSHSQSTSQNHICPGISCFGEPTIYTCLCAFVCVCYDKNDPIVIVTQLEKERYVYHFYNHS